jgi:hypothetical protein
VVVRRDRAVDVISVTADEHQRAVPGVHGRLPAVGLEVQLRASQVRERLGSRRPIGESQLREACRERPLEEDTRHRCLELDIVCERKIRSVGLGHPTRMVIVPLRRPFQIQTRAADGRDLAVLTGWLK